MRCLFSGHSLCLDDEVVRVVPVGQQVSGVIVIHTDVVVTEGPWEEVVNLSGHVEDIAHPGGGGLGRRLLSKQQQNLKLQKKHLEIWEQGHLAYNCLGSFVLLCSKNYEN